MTRFRSVALLALLIPAQCAFAASPLRLLSETYSEWKERLFGHPAPAVVQAPASGPIALLAGHPQKLHVDAKTPERDFGKGNTHYRVIELPAEIEHAAVRLQVLTERNENGHGNAVFKPWLYVLADDDSAGVAVEANPLYLDIRPFRRTRLLACVKLDKVRRFAIATSPDAVGKSYESGVRDAVKAPTQGGFYYTTDAMKVKLPYLATGTVILEVITEDKSGKGC